MFPEAEPYPPVIIADEAVGTRLAPARRAARLVRAALRHVLDIVYPPACLACSAATAEPDRLCAPCWRKVRFIERPYCERLGIPFERDLGGPLLSPQAIAEPPEFDRARAVAHFAEGPVRDLVHRLKYGDRIELARPMGRWMARAGAELLMDADFLLPVPLHRWRLWTRRFNQAHALAGEIAKVTGVRADPLALERVKSTKPQVRLSRAQRAQNVQGAFRVPQDALPRLIDKRVVLVDDVLTSGATLEAAARALRRAGARRVDVLVFARVVANPKLPI
jgi:ComF family protein